jgi:hypothetical protein
MNKLVTLSVVSLAAISAFSQTVTNLDPPNPTRSGLVLVHGIGLGTGAGQTLTVGGRPVHIARWTPTFIELFVAEETPLGNQALTLNGAQIATVDVRERSPLPGRFQWRLKVPDQYIITRPAVGPDGTIYAVGNYGHLYAVTPDGALKWVRTAGDGTVDVDSQGRVFCAGGGGIQAYSPDGDRLWTFQIDTPLLAGPNVGPDGRIYIVDNIRWLGNIRGAMVLDRNGNLLWNGGEYFGRGANDAPHEITFDSENAYFFSGSGPSGGTPGLTAIQLGGGIRFHHGSGVGRPPTGLATGGVAYIAPSTVENVDETGDPRWSRSLWDFGGYQTKGDVVSTPDGSVFTLLSNSRMIGFHPDGSTRVHTPLVDIPSWLTPRPDGNAFLVETMVNFGVPKKIRAFTPSGSLLWTSEDLPLEGGTTISVFNRIKVTDDSMTAYFGTSGPMTSANTAYSYLYAIDAAERSLPTALNMVRGVAVSGGLAEIQSSDDQRAVYGPGITFSTGDSPLQLEVSGVSSTQNPSILRFRLESRASSPSIRQTVELWDYVAGGYEIVSVTQSTLEDSTVEVQATNPARFVQAGTRALRARLSYKANGPVFAYPWRVGIDRAMWTLR